MAPTLKRLLALLKELWRPRTVLVNAYSKGGLMVIVAGHLMVDPNNRRNYLQGCVEVVERARRAPGCLDFALSADLLDPGRINIFERWESQAAVEAFRQDGTDDEQAAVILAASVAEYDVADTRTLA